MLQGLVRYERTSLQCSTPALQLDPEKGTSCIIQLAVMENKQYRSLPAAVWNTGWESRYSNGESSVLRLRSLAPFLQRVCVSCRLRNLSAVIRASDPEEIRGSWRS